MVRVASFQGLHTQPCRLHFVLQVTKAGRRGLGTRLGFGSAVIHYNDSDTLQPSLVEVVGPTWSNVWYVAVVNARRP